ncbi:hypothetical protein NESM_000811600 [Novymonas esmeraldas]|uniref:DUF2382 domain-containing protein n=1 Tax=Novymonas esmeraldas TaxID=1808958 RepID=A0AAW0EXJ0_9TRYP
MRATPHYPPARHAVATSAAPQHAYPAPRRHAPPAHATSNTSSSTPHRTSYHHGVNRSLSYPDPAPPSPPSPPPLQQQQQQQHREPKSVVYTVQDSHTDTRAHETEYGGVLTIRTTTVTRTITEQLVASDEDDDDDSSSNGGEVRVERQITEAQRP